MRRGLEGDLQPGAAKLGSSIRCVIVPDMSLCLLVDPTLQLTMPTVGAKYKIRANILVGTYSGVLLQEIKNDPISVSQLISGEPFFPHRCFNFIG